MEQIKESLILDHCWVCGSIESKHDHHVIPRCYGGNNGPTVTVCANHHNLIHALALKTPDVAEGLILQEINPERVRYLVACIRMAASLAKGSVKPIQLSIKLSLEASNILRSLGKALGKSQKDIVELALAELSRKYPH